MCSFIFIRFYRGTPCYVSHCTQSVTDMKKIRSFLVAFFIILSVASPLSINSVAASVISERGQIAIEQIATCINSDGKDLLNVLYLIDESGSLDWNDPDNLRVQGLVKSLEQFKDVSTSKPYFTINRALTTFGDKFTVRKSWERLNTDTLQKDIKWIQDTVPGLNEGKYTDWNLGLKGTLKEFAAVQSKNSCNVLVWFTDGGVQVSDTLSATRSSLSEICGVDPVTGQSSNKDALIDKFRRSGINIQGVLLRNQAFIDDPVKVAKYSKQEAANEIARMSFFLPVIEQEGGVSSGAFTPNGGLSNYKCGTYTGAGGVLQTVSDPLDIIWPPVQFSCLANNGRVLTIIGGKVKIDSALTRFTLTSPSKNFGLKNSDGASIATDQGPVKGDVRFKHINTSKSVLEISGTINSANAITKPGIWSISSADMERVVFCGYLDLGIDLKVGTCYIGEKCDYTGRVTRFGAAIDLSSFQSVKTSSSLFDELGNDLPEAVLTLNPADATFESSFTPTESKPIANLKITLNVVTETGIEFTLGTIKPVAVIPPGEYPEITPSPIKVENFLQSLDGKQGVAIADLNLTGPSRTNGQICISRLEVRSDVNPNRIEGYVSKLGDKKLSDKAECFTLLAGSNQTVKLEVSNNESADGLVSGYMKATLKADGKQDIQTKVDVQFKTTAPVDNKKLILYIILFMFLGLALPLTLLTIMNSRNSRLVFDNIYRASIPILLSASGNFVTPSRVEKGKTSDLLSHEDFSPFSAGKEVVRSKQVGTELFTGRAPKNPFGNLQAKVTTQPGMVIATSAFTSGKNKLGNNEAQGALNPSGLIYVTLNESANQILKLQNQGSDIGNQKIEGSLTALLSLNTGDPVTQIDYLNTRIMHEGGWLNNLLEITPAAISQSKTRDLKKSRKNKKSIKAEVQSVTDDWGSPAIQSSNQGNTASPPPSPNSPSTGDDWGSPSSSGDWETPGSSNNSGLKEEW